MARSFQPRRRTTGEDPLKKSGLNSPVPRRDPLSGSIPPPPKKTAGTANDSHPRDSKRSIFLGESAPKLPRRTTSAPPVPSRRAPVQEVSDDDFSSLSDGTVLEWTDDSSNDEADAPGAEGLRDYEKVSPRKKRKRSVRLVDRDMEIVELLARYKFVYRRQIERHFGVKNLSRRLTQLAKAGLIRNEKITESAAVWTATQAGIEWVEMTVPPMSHGRIAPSTLSHTIGLFKLGSDFERGDKGANIFGEGWPFNWRRVTEYDGSYSFISGETVLTERVITQSYNRTLAIHKIDWMVQEFENAMRWKPEPGATGEDLYGPEADEGNEWMFVGLPPYKAHVPDMVLLRPRNADGSVEHIAIELELKAKKISALKEILVNFKASRAFKKVVYFTHKRQVVNDLINVDKNYVGLGSKLMVKRYIPENKNARWG